MQRSLNKIIYLLFTITAIAVIVNACKKDEPVPHNPYDDVDYVTPPSPVDTLDPTSFVGLHKNVFSPRCAVPGCHDGHFEPDFRTIQSSYSTLVYHPVIKNSPDSIFQFRVVPNDTAMSVLWERLTNCCFVNQDDRMPQDNIGVPLEDEHLNNIAAWIMGGAKDMMGQVATYPNTEPRVLFYLAINSTFDTIYSNNRIDSVFYNPFIAPVNSDMLIGIVVEDDSTALADLQYNRLKMSYDQNDFSSSAPGYQEYFATYVQDPQNGDEFYLVTMNTGDFQPGNIVYMRYYLNDGDHTQNTEFPTDESIEPYKTFYSFYIPN